MAKDGSGLMKLVFNDVNTNLQGDGKTNLLAVVSKGLYILMKHIPLGEEKEK